MSNSTEQKVVKIIADGKQAEASINQITRAVSALNRERNKEKVGSERYKDLSKDLAGLNQRLVTARNEVKKLDTASKKFWGNFKTIAAGVVGGSLITSAIQGIGGFINKIIDKQKELSDSYANIRKVTGLTLEQVSDLDKKLSGIDTRTGRKELRELAVEAGKLGISGVNDIARFVKEADQIRVALGEDLGEGAVTTLGRLSNIFKVSLLEIGSAINEIGANSAATEAYQVDFLNRMAGTGPTVKLAADELLGYSATLENMGQSAEVSGTALSKFFLEFIKDTEKFGRIAGMQKGVLTEVFNSKGTNAAFLAFLENLKKSKSGAVQMAQALDEMGIDGSRSTGVFLALSNSIEDVHKQQAIANKGLTEGISLTNEFNIKNDTFAAKWEKLMKSIQGSIQNSGLVKFFNNILTSFVEFSTVTMTVNDEINEMVKGMLEIQTAMNIDLDILKENNLSQEARKDLIKQVNEAYGEYLPNLLTEKSTIEEITKAQEFANKALERNMFIKVGQKKLEEQQNKLLEAQTNLKLKEIALARLEKEMVVDDQIRATTGVSTKDYKKGLINVQSTDTLKKDIAAAQRNVEDLTAAIDALSSEKYGKSFTELASDAIHGGEKGAESLKKSKKALTETEKHNKKVFVLNKELIDALNAYRSEWEKIQKSPMSAEKKEFLAQPEKFDGTKINKDISVEVENLRAQKRQEQEDEKRAQNQMIMDNSIMLGEQLIDGTMNHIATKNRMEMEATLKHLEAKREAELSQANLTERQKMEIELRYENQRKQVLNENAKRERNAALWRIGIDTAVAAVKALSTDPTGILTAFAIAQGIAQAGFVSAQPIPQYFKGGVTGAQDGKLYNAQNIGSFSGGGIYNQPSVGLIGERGAELVIPNWLYKSPKMVNTMGALESMIYNAKPFADGGSTAPVMSSAAGFDDREIKALFKMNVAMINSLNKTLESGIIAKTFYDRVEYEKFTNRNEKVKSISKL
jgi:TP901 family phage tail tape measure protein